MRLNSPVNSNYCATITKIRNLIPLDNCDNVVATSLFGFQSIVGKDTQVDDLGIVFTAETQLSEEYCRMNNLFRHADKNTDPTKAGYIEDNRRIKAIKFRGHRSDALFMPLSSLSYLGINPEDFNEGDEFDELYGHAICKKYELPVKGLPSYMQKEDDKRFKRVDKLFMPEHFSTDNYFKNDRKIGDDTEVIVTQKLHGTSIRIANTVVRRRPKFIERIASKLGVLIKDQDFDYVYGSRKVIKDINNPDQKHYYEASDGMDLWTKEGKRLEGLVPENFLIYGELIGYTPTGSPIQQGYTYNFPIGICELYIYRVAFVNAKGLVTDLSWDMLKEFCTQRGLKYVPEIYRGSHKKFKVEKYIDKILCQKHKQCLRLDNNGTVDEGVCVRIEGLNPSIYKAKSPKFFEHETALIDKGQEDIKSNQSITTEE